VKALVLLAAGRSVRFGEANKLLMPLNGKPLASYAADAARGAPVELRIAVVYDDAIVPLLDGFEIVRNAAPEAGQSTSMIAGLRRAIEQSASTVVFQLADMPRITSTDIASILTLAERHRIAATTDGARRMPPVGVTEPFFPELFEASGDAGARALLKSLPTDALHPVPKDVATDVDTPEDLAALNALDQ